MGNITLSIKNDEIYAEYDEPVDKLLLIATNMSRVAGAKYEDRDKFSLDLTAYKGFRDISMSLNRVAGAGFFNCRRQITLTRAFMGTHGHISISVVLEAKARLVRETLNRL